MPAYDPRLAMWDREYRRQRAAGAQPHEAQAAADAKYPDPKARNVRGLGALDANTLEQWSGKRFRKPDVFDGRSAAWYGPDGPDGEHATVATSDDDGVIVWEYTYVVGLIEDPYADYAVTKTHLSYDDIEQAVGTIWSARGRASALFLQWAASIGVAKLAYHGGEESWANQLPR